MVPDDHLRERDMSDLQKLLQTRGLSAPGLPPRPSVGRGGRGALAGSRNNFVSKRDYSGIPWSNYWDTKDFVSVPEGKFCYLSSGPPSGCVTVVCLHGGGYSALTWSLVARELTGLVTCRVVAIDLRGHGETECSQEGDLSGEQMAQDVASVLTSLPRDKDGGLVLVGHSMGGALAVLAGEKEIPGLVGLVVIDVVEGTALEALASMHTVLSNRPSKFNSVEQAVEWAVRSGQVRNVESARVSMPGQIVSPEGVLAAALISPSPEAGESRGEAGPPCKRSNSEPARDSIREEEEEGDEDVPKNENNAKKE